MKNWNVEREIESVTREIESLDAEVAKFTQEKIKSKKEADLLGTCIVGGTVGFMLMAWYLMVM